MRLLRGLVAGLRAIVSRSRDLEEIDADLREYLACAVEERVALGVDRATAEREARVDAGSLLAARDEVRQSGWEHTADCVWQDVRLGVRGLRRDAGFSTVLVLTLALGIGSTTAIGALVHTAYWRELPIAEPDRVVRLLDAHTDSTARTQLSNMTAAHAAIAIDATRATEGIVVMFGRPSRLTAPGFSERAMVVHRTSGWRPALGVVPVLGRDFTADEEERGTASGVALVSHDLWHRRFAGAVPEQVTLHVDDTVVTVVGVMPPGFRFPYEADVWRPLQPRELPPRQDVVVFARLAAGVSREAFDTELTSVSARIRESAPGAAASYGVGVRTLRDNLLERQDVPTWALVSTVGCLLLLTCVSVMALLTARATARRHEFATRAALGATRTRQIRQLLTETCVVAGIGGVFGVVLAALLIPSLSALIPANLGVQLGLSTPVLDGRVVVASAVVTLGAALVSGLAPAVGILRPVTGGLAAGNRTRTPPRWPLRTLVGVQSALALALVSVGGFALASVNRLQDRDLGFEVDRLWTAPVTMPDRATSAARGEDLRTLLNEVASEPGIAAAGATTSHPLRRSSWLGPVTFGEASAEETVTVRYQLISPGLLRAMGTPLLHGRDFAWSDAEDRAPVAIVSAQLAKRIGSLDTVVGRKVRMDGETSVTIVGVAGDVTGADALVRAEIWYVPYLQHAGGRVADEVHLMIRTTGAQANGGFESAASPLVPMAAVRADALRPLRTIAFAMTSAGALGLLLAALGTYGLVTYAARQGSREIAIRAALGARRVALMGLLCRDAVRPTAIGLTAGTAAALGLNAMLARLLPAVAAVEPRPLVSAAAALLAASALAAALASARGVSRDVTAAIRVD